MSDDSKLCWLAIVACFAIAVALIEAFVPQ